MEPLTRLKEAAVSVANGNYEIKVPSEGKTELAQVGKSFNLMTGKVREQIEKLSSVNQAQRQLLGSLASVHHYWFYFTFNRSILLEVYYASI